ncbi:hypothetical protein THF1A12_80175 [Vibrio jasicida]|uniref:Uncharacterized protein n=1 Tax=Vibrio jasicida TaxID=766224 RepID=A0AAU9QXB2_9VIBR|nr:hypothetical protein THF1A12_80175 [Vibrio jasicida]
MIAGRWNRRHDQNTHQRQTASSEVFKEHSFIESTGTPESERAQ